MPSMPPPVRRLLCLGFGYTAAALARELRAGGGWRVSGTTRDAGRLAAIAALGVDARRWTGDPLPAAAFEGIDGLLISAGPGDAGCPVYAAAADAVVARGGALRWIGYLSSTAVYGDHGGEWIDEASELRAAAPRARRRLQAEQQWRALGERSGVPVVVFRLPGIYGPGRCAIDRVRAGTARRVFKPDQVFSRAHVDDIAAVLAASLRAPAAGTLFNVADDEPAPPQDVIEYACRLLGVPAPPLEPLESAGLSAAARAFYDDNKRVRNARMKSALGVVPRYPSYREGLTAILRGDGG